MKYLEIAKQHDWVKVSTIQNPYNLLNRSYEVGLAEVSHRENVGLLAYSPMAFGALSGKYILGTSKERDRLNLWPSYGRYTNELAVQATKMYIEVAKKYELSPAQLALNFVTSRPFVTSNIIGATTIEQLEENINSVERPFTQEMMDEINYIHQLISNPSP